MSRFLCCYGSSECNAEPGMRIFSRDGHKLSAFVTLVPSLSLSGVYQGES